MMPATPIFECDFEAIHLAFTSQRYAIESGWIVAVSNVQGIFLFEKVIEVAGNVTQIDAEASHTFHNLLILISQPIGTFILLLYNPEASKT